MKIYFTLVLILISFCFIKAQNIINISDKVHYEHTSKLKKDTIVLLDSLNIKYQHIGNCRAFSSQKYAQASNGEAHSSNIAKANNGKFGSNLLDLYLCEKEFRKYNKKYLGHTLFFLNTSDEKFEVSAQDSRLSIITEILDQNGKWVSITYLPSSWCGNSYHTITLGENEYWEFIQPIFKGDFKTKLRYRLTTKEYTFVSNEIDALINDEQLNKEEDEDMQKIMNFMNDGK